MVIRDNLTVWPLILTVIFLVCPIEDRRRFMLEALDMGMCDGEYVFYTVDMIPDQEILNAEDVWKGNDGRDKEAKEAFESVFHVSQITRRKNY